MDRAKTLNGFRGTLIYKPMVFQMDNIKLKFVMWNICEWGQNLKFSGKNFYHNHTLATGHDTGFKEQPQHWTFISHKLHYYITGRQWGCLTLEVLQQAAVLHQLRDDVDGLLHGADSVQLNELVMPQPFHYLSLSQEVLRVHGTCEVCSDGVLGVTLWHVIVL